MMLMLLIAFMGMTLQSCGSDDDSSDKASYTLSASITDQGNMPELMVVALEGVFSQISQTVVTTLSDAKSTMDSAINQYKSTFANGYNYTITFYLKDSSGNVKYTKKIICKGQTVTVE